jgi:hypothetical protein
MGDVMNGLEFYFYNEETNKVKLHNKESSKIRVRHAQITFYHGAYRAVVCDENKNIYIYSLISSNNSMEKIADFHLNSKVNKIF